MSQKYFDIHSHIHFPEYESDILSVLGRMKESGVCTITVGTDTASSQRAIDFAEHNENVFASVGLHPGDNTKEVFVRDEYAKLVSSQKAVAIGECGLDYFRLADGSEEEKKRQKNEFEKQIQFAIDYNKPLMLHVRDAYEDALDILNIYKKKYGDKLRGNSHFFAGDLVVAKKLLDIDFTMSFTGVLTFARNYDEVVKYLPLTHIMSETDAPYVAPVPFRGKRNEPEYVKYVVQAIADIRQESIDSVAPILYKNAINFFGLKM